MLNRARAVVAATLLGVAVAPPCVAAEWFLLSREGGCVALEALKRKLPGMPAVQTPDAFEAYLKAGHLAYSRQVHAAVPGEFNEFEVPAAGLSVVMVPRQQCGQILPGPR